MDLRKVPCINIFISTQNAIHPVYDFYHTFWSLYTYNLFHNLLHISSSFWVALCGTVCGFCLENEDSSFNLANRYNAEVATVSIEWSAVMVHQPIRSHLLLGDPSEIITREVFGGTQILLFFGGGFRFCKSSKEGVPDFDNPYKDRFGWWKSKGFHTPKW